MTTEQRQKEIIAWIDEDYNRQYTLLISYIHHIAYEAYKTGAARQPIGLNVPVEDRAEDYCKEQGLIP